MYGYSRSTSEPTKTMEEGYEIIKTEFELIYNKLKDLIETDLKNLEYKMEEIGAPWTPGRLPDWE